MPEFTLVCILVHCGSANHWMATYGAKLMILEHNFMGVAVIFTMKLHQQTSAIPGHVPDDLAWVFGNGGNGKHSGV